MKFSQLNRVVHRWGSIIVLIPAGVIVLSGIVLQLKKQSAWIQPPTQKGSAAELSLSFDQILAAAQTVPEAQVETWDDIDRLDVRPGKGMLKVRCQNRWEVQLDTKTGEVLQVAYRRSDLIESLHDGSFFHDRVKLWLFFPSAMVLGVLWVTGVYLFILPYFAKWKKRRKKARVDKQGPSLKSKGPE
jgi:uncharacterized iron-regulated membrane protein